MIWSYWDHLDIMEEKAIYILYAILYVMMNVQFHSADDAILSCVLGLRPQARSQGFAGLERTQFFYK